MPDEGDEKVAENEEVPIDAQIEYIGYDANTHQQPLIQDTIPGAHGMPLPFDGPVKPGTPDTKKAYQALAAIETLQLQLVWVEYLTDLPLPNIFWTNGKHVIQLLSYLHVCTT